MITITIQPQTPEQLSAALKLLAEFQAGSYIPPSPEPVEVKVEAPKPRAKKPAATPPAAETAPVEPAAPAPVAESPSEPVDNTVTLVELRAKLAELSRDGKADKVKALLADLGANKLTELAASDYGAAMARAKEL